MKILKDREWRRLVHSPTNRHEYFELELSGAWKPLNKSGLLPDGEGKEAQLGFPCQNQMSTK
jgi:hypothetical protein